MTQMASGLLGWYLLKT